MKVCDVQECERASRSRGLCNLHLHRWRSHGDALYVPTGSMTEVERFWHYVDRSNPEGCWLWRGGRSRSGYGVFATGSRSDASLRFVGAHRYSYALVGDTIPDGYQIDHLCRVKHCVRPDHLEAVTAQENTLRGTGPSARNARLTHCKRGHPFDAKNTWLDPKRNTRQCRACNAYRARRRQQTLASLSKEEAAFARTGP